MTNEELLQRWGDGSITADQLRELTAKLAEPEHQSALLEDWLLESSLPGRLPAASVAALPEAPQRSPLLKVAALPHTGRWNGWLSRPPLAAAAAALVVLVTAAVWLGAREGRVLTLVDASGALAWSGDGTRRSDLTVGEKLAPGTIETVGEEASASVRFRDGTLLTLSGDSELSFSEDGQKLLVLRKGSLSAQVKPQPKDKPMLVRTPSAEAQVVGTIFNLAARADDTLLKVDEGLVQLKRLADGSMIDVPAKSSAVASLDSGLKLNSTTTPEPLTDWRFDFETRMPPRDWRGTFDGKHMMASPYVASRKASGAVVTHFGVSVRTAQLMPPLSLVLTSRSVIRYRLRQNQSKPLQLMLLTSKTSGGFGGNFEARLDAGDLKPNSDGWCVVAVPLSAFRPLAPKHASPVGNIVTSALISSLQTDTKLTVAHFELKSEP